MSSPTFDSDTFVTPPTSPSNHAFPTVSPPLSPSSPKFRQPIPIMPRAPSSTVSLSTTTATILGSSSGSKRNPAPVQTFPISMDPSRSTTVEGSRDTLAASLAESLNISGAPAPPKKEKKWELPVHPFANSTAKLELLPADGERTAHGIDVEEEARLYAELMQMENDEGLYEDKTDSFTRTNTPVGRQRTLSHPWNPSAHHHQAKLHKPRHINTFPRPQPSSSSSNQRFNYPTHASRLASSSETHLPLAYTPYRGGGGGGGSRSGIRPSQSHSHLSADVQSIFSADIFLADERSAGQDAGGVDGSGRGAAPPLFAKDVRIDGWVVVGDGASARESILSSPVLSSPTRSPTISQSSSSQSQSQSPSTPISATMAPPTPTLARSQIGSLRKVSTGAGAYVVYDCAIVTREGTTMRILKRYSAFEELWDALKGRLDPILRPQIPPLPPKAPLARFRPAFLEKRRQLLEFWLTRVLLHPELGGREVVREWVLR